MAYKFQLGQAQMSGALVQEGAIKLHNEAGSEVASVAQTGIVSGSAAGKFSTLSIDSVQVFSAAQQLQNVASLDATSEAAIEGAIDTLANLSSAGSTGVDLDVLGPLDVQEGIKQNGTEILSDAGALKAIASVSGSGAFQGGSAAFGTSVTAGTSFIIGSADLNEADMEKLDGITNGTVAASKAVVVDANKDAAGFRDVSGRTVSGSGNATFLGNYVGGGSVTAGSSFIIGSADLNETDLEKLDGITNGTVAASKAVVVDASKDVAGFRNVTSTGTVSGSILEASTSIVIGNASINEAELETIDGVTAGTVAASKAVVVDASKDISGFRNVTATGYFEIGSAQLNEADMEKIDGITNGTAAASKALVLDASKNITGITNLTASFFKGNGSGLTNVDAVTSVSASSANVSYELAFTEYLGSDVELGGNAGLTFNPAGNNGANGFSGSLAVSASHNGVQMSRILLGSKDDGQIKYYDDGGDLVLFFGSANAGLDLSGSNEGGIVLAGGDSAGTIVKGNGQFLVQNAAEQTKASIAGSTGNASFATISGTSVSGSGNFSIGGTLTADSLGSATVNLTADLMIIDDGASGAIKTTSLANYATALAAGSNEGLSSTAGRLGLDLNDLSALGSAGVVAADQLAFVDATDNGTKKVTMANFLSSIAGAGISVSSGKLITDSGAVQTVADGGTLAEGYNYLADISSNATVSLPAAPTVGDVVHVKAADLNSGANVIIQKQGSHTIDDDHTSVRIESSFGAVSLVYVVANKWRIV